MSVKPEIARLVYHLARKKEIYSFGTCFNTNFDQRNFSMEHMIFDNTKFFITPCSDHFPVLVRKIIEGGGCIVSSAQAADICIAPTGSGIRDRGWYHATLIEESIRLGNIPCLRRFDASTNDPQAPSIRGKRANIFEGLVFWYPPEAVDDPLIRYKIELKGGSLNHWSQSGHISLVPRGWTVYDEEEWISSEYIDHCIEIGEVDCFCGFEV